MPDISAIPVTSVEEGTLVRVLLPSASKYARPRHNGLHRSSPGGNLDVLQYRDWNRLVGFSRRKFLARVVTNDTVKQQLVLKITNARTTKDTQINYQVVLPYNQIIRLSRLVFQGREFASIEDEEEFRRQHRENPVDKAYFDPKDRFVGVSMVAILEGNMIINFTHQVAVTGSSFTVTLPVDVFADGDYTVMATYNTPVGAPPQLWMPDADRTKDDFVARSLGGGNIDAGTTVDFHVQAR
jgi:hypothetical protein